VQPGAQQFNWNGVGSTGQQWPDGNYTLSITATDTTGKSVAVPTQINGVVSSVDLTQNPPMLTVAGQNFTVNQILRVIAPSTPASSVGSALSNAASAVGNAVNSVL
jgi:flagellar basal-body rod modification protein FlgD